MDENRGELSTLLQQLVAFKVPVILGVISITSILLAVASFYKMSHSQKPIEFVLGEGSPSAKLDKTITIDVAGAVALPGVYVLKDGARIEDALRQAGGIIEEANSEWVEKSLNRAAKVVDGMKIYVPHKNEAIVVPSVASHNIEAGEVGKTIGINTATQAELEALPGIGPATATKIIDNRPYVTVEELVTKKVVGKKTFDKVAGRLSL